jgi:hypothetical protein
VLAVADEIGEHQIARDGDVDCSVGAERRDRQRGDRDRRRARRSQAAPVDEPGGRCARQNERGDLGGEGERVGVCRRQPDAQRRQRDDGAESRRPRVRQNGGEGGRRQTGERAERGRGDRFGRMGEPVGEQPDRKAEGEARRQRERAARRGGLSATHGESGG